MVTNLTDKVIVIGSSCGGSHAVPYLVNKIDRNNCKIILIPHIDYEEIQSTLLKRGIISELICYEDVENFNLKSEGVYITKFGKDAYLNEFNLINDAFRNSSKKYKENLIGVVLTGAGSDGADGLKDIKLNGGKIMAQSKPRFIDYLLHIKSIGMLHCKNMPEKAKEMNNLDYFGSLPQLANKINKLI